MPFAFSYLDVPAPQTNILRFEAGKAPRICAVARLGTSIAPEFGHVEGDVCDWRQLGRRASAGLPWRLERYTAWLVNAKRF